MLDRVQIKSEAKQTVRTARISPLLVTAVVMLLLFVLDRLVDLVQHGSPFYTYTYTMEYYRILASGDTSMLPSLLLDQGAAGTARAGFISILVSLFTTVLMGGYYLYNIGIRRGREMSCAALLDGLGHAGRLIACYILMTVKIALWSMLFVIPGIVATYRYRFAYYNLLTDDSLSASEAIRLSCEQTRGMKGDLFLLDWSFFGWELLSSLTFGLLGLWLTPYQTQCDLAYFEEGQRRVGRAPYQEDGPMDPGEYTL